MTTSRDQFQQAAINALAQFPTVAQFVQAGDPRALAQIGAMATMLAMMSEQVDAAQMEPFTKVRDSTVLADASLKGILPLARACRVSLSVTNNGAASFSVAAGRRFIDSKGRIFEAESAVAIAVGATAAVTCAQRTKRTIAHTVSTAVAFYQVEVTQTDAAVFLNTLTVWKGAQEFAYSPDWFNVQPGDFAYQAETDERRRLWVRFGSTSVVGYGVLPGDALELRVTECEGRISDLTPGAAFGLEYSYTLADGSIKAVLGAVLDEGASPPSMADLRVMSRYPAIYDHNAVYLGEFDMLLRRYLSPVRFMSVWNEQIEERARGADSDSINTLFVCGLITGMTNAAFEARAVELIGRADDSYRVRFVPVALSPVTIVITGRVAVVHDSDTVKSQIRAAILGAYGDGQPDVSRGMSNPIRYQAVSKLLREKVAAFQDEMADFTVQVTLPATPLPEQFLYVSDASLTVTIERASFGNGLWGY